MRMTEEGLALIKCFEGFRGTAYLCPAGVWTIGYGHTSQTGEPAVTRGMLVSEKMAADILGSDVGTFAVGVMKELRRNINDALFSALVSFVCNVGLGAAAWIIRERLLKSKEEGIR